MIPQQTKKIVGYFIAIYIAFGLLLVYLFLFNTGLEIIEEFNEQTASKDVYIYNNTDRIINNVEIKIRENETETEFAKLKFLAPKEKRLLELPTTISQAIIIATAPFHVTVEKLVVLKVKGQNTVKLSFPETIEFGKSFKFTVDLCNQNTDDTQYKIEEEHEPGFFSEPSKTEVTTIEATKCKTLEYTLTPIGKGETTIYFNVNSENTTDQVQQTITVD
ncbi:MAG TPA: hypothetical protein VFF13_01735 [archaeon]|nr:hypothetical protein [archaeon]